MSMKKGTTEYYVEINDLGVFAYRGMYSEVAFMCCTVQCPRENCRKDAAIKVKEF
jgi:preprotein translocase subunit SecB